MLSPTTTPIAGSSEAAKFTAPPPNTKAYTGSEFKGYNFPNPFDLKTKTLEIVDDIRYDTQATPPTMTTQGTIIKYYMPSSESGDTEIFPLFPV